MEGPADLVIEWRKSVLINCAPSSFASLSFAPLRSALVRFAQEEHPVSLSRGDCKVATLPRKEPSEKRL